MVRVGSLKHVFVETPLFDFCFFWCVENWEKPDANSTKKRKLKYRHSRERKHESFFQYTGFFIYEFTWLGPRLGKWYLGHLCCFLS